MAARSFAPRTKTALSHALLSRRYPSQWSKLRCEPVYPRENPESIWGNDNAAKSDRVFADTWSSAGVDKQVHEDREERKTQIQLGQNSAVQNGTAKNRQVVSDRNKRVGHGGASRDRTAQEC
jgi:hypothetical protein